MSLRVATWVFFAVLSGGLLGSRAADTTNEEAAVHQVFQSKILENTGLRYVKDSGVSFYSFICDASLNRG